jgi:hypothetical protein
MPSTSRPVMTIGDANIEANHLVQLIDDTSRIRADDAVTDPEYQAFEDLDGIPDSEVHRSRHSHAFV